MTDNRQVNPLENPQTNSGIEILVVVDKEFRVQSASQSFYRFLEETYKGAKGRLIDKISEDEGWDFQDLKAKYEEIQSSPNYIEGLGIELGAVKVHGKVLLVTARQLLMEDMQPNLLLLILQEEKETDASPNSMLLLDERYAFDMQVIMDDQLRVVSANQRYYEFFHTTDQTTEGQTWQQVGAHQWDIPQLTELLREVTHDKRSFQGFKIDYNFPRIGQKSLRLKAQNLVRYDGEPDLVLLTIEDLTEQREIEKEIKALRSSKERFEVIFNNTYQFTGLMDRNGRMLEANQTALDFVGITLQDVVDKRVWETPWFQEADLFHLRQAVRRAANGDLVRYELDIVGKDSQVITIDFSLKPNFTKKGRVRWIIAEGRDISEKKEMERELEHSREEAIRSREMLNSVVNHIGLGVKYMKAVRYPSGALVDFEFVQLNQQAKDLLFLKEVAQEEIVGERLLHILPEVGQVNFQNYKEVLETGKTIKTETQYAHTHGQQWFHRTVVKLGDGVVVTFEDITQRKRAELELKRSKQLIDSVYESASAGIDALTAQRNTEGTIVDFVYQRTNQKSREIKQQPDFDFNGKTLLTLFPGVQEEGLFEQYAAVVETGKTYHDIIYYDHEQFKSWFDLTVSKWDDGIVMTLVEITEQKLAEEKVKASEQQWRTLVSNIPDVITRHDLDLRYTFISPLVEKLTGKQSAEFIGKTDREMGFPEENVTRYQKRLKSVLETGEESSMLNRVVTPSGERYISTKIVLEYDHQAKPASILGIARDVTDIKKSEQKVRESEQFLLATQEIAEIGSFAYHSADKSIIGSPKLFDILGIAYQERMALDSFFEKLHPEDRERVVQSIDQAIENQIDYRDEYRVVAEPKKVKYLLTIGKVETDEIGNTQILGVVMDVSSIRSIEQELRKRTHELEVTNQEQSSFTYSISHDLRTPLRAINGFVNLFLGKYEDQLDDEGRRLLGVVQANVSRMGKLIDDLLHFSHLGKQPISLRVLNIEEMFQNVFDDLNPIYTNSQAQLRIHSLPLVKADRKMIRQVIENLLSNALKFSSNQQQPRIEVGLQPGMKHPVFYVRDNGVGFDQKYHGKLFEVFQRLHRVDEFEGTGVGLANVQKIIQRHGGTIWAEGVVNKGSTFYFSLPQ